MSRMVRAIILATFLLTTMVVASTPAWSASGRGSLDGYTEATSHGASFRTCSGIMGGADFVIAKPTTGSLEGISLTSPHDNADLAHEFKGNNFNLSPRFWLGYVNQSGCGVRFRYWNYDHELESEAATFGVPGVIALTNRGGLEVQAVDIEATQQIELGRWNANVAAGLRVGHVAHDSNLNFDIFDSTIFDLHTRNSFDGVGPTIAAELRRRMGSSDLQFVVTGRGAFLFGTSTQTFACNQNLDFTYLRNNGVEASLLPAASMTVKRDQLISVAELQFGLEWTKDLKSGATVFVEGLFEGQVWANTGGNHMTMTKSSDLGMVGFVFGAGISR